MDESDIKIYLSGGSANTDPNASLGGERSTTELTDDTIANLFANVSAGEAETGSTKYRAVFVRNEHSTDTFEAIKAYIESQTTGDSKIEISVATEDKNDPIQTIADEDTAPNTQTFTDEEDPDNGQDVTDLEPNDFKGIWIKRIIDPNASATGEDSGQIGLRGEIA